MSSRSSLRSYVLHQPRLGAQGPSSLALAMPGMNTEPPPQHHPTSAPVAQARDPRSPNNHLVAPATPGSQGSCGSVGEQAPATGYASTGVTDLHQSLPPPSLQPLASQHGAPVPTTTHPGAPHTAAAVPHPLPSRSNFQGVPDPSSHVPPAPSTMRDLISAPSEQPIQGDLTSSRYAPAFPSAPLPQAPQQPPATMYAASGYPSHFRMWGPPPTTTATFPSSSRGSGPTYYRSTVPLSVNEFAAPYVPAQQPARGGSSGSVHPPLPPLSQAFPPVPPQPAVHGLLAPQPSVPQQLVSEVVAPMTGGFQHERYDGMGMEPVQSPIMVAPAAEQFEGDKPWLSLVENITLESIDWFDSLLYPPDDRTADPTGCSTPHSSHYAGHDYVPSGEHQQSNAPSPQQQQPRGSGSVNMMRAPSTTTAAPHPSLPQYMSVSSLVSPSPSKPQPQPQSHTQLHNFSDRLPLSPSQLAMLAPVAGADANHWVEAAWNGDSLISGST